MLYIKLIKLEEADRKDRPLRLNLMQKGKEWSEILHTEDHQDDKKKRKKGERKGESIPNGQKRISDSLELELQAVSVSCPAFILGTKL